MDGSDVKQSMKIHAFSYRVHVVAKLQSRSSCGPHLRACRLLGRVGRRALLVCESIGVQPHPCVRPKTPMVATTSSLERYVVQRLGLFAQTHYLSWELKKSNDGQGSGVLCELAS